MSDNTLYSLDKLQYDVLQVVTSPLDDLHTFMYSVLECFHENIDAYGYLFYQYDEDPCNPGRYITRDPVSINLPSAIWGENWRNSYYDTSIYNPNVRRTLLEQEKSVFTVGNLISPEEYENSRNYRDLLKPAGIYYSFAVILKHNKVPLGHLTLSRPKEMGNFSQEELKRIEQISKSISNRLLDYRKLSTFEDVTSLEKFFQQYVSEPGVGAILLTDSHRVLYYNDRAVDFCGEILAGKSDASAVLDNPAESIQKMADAIAVNCIPRYSVFEQWGKDGRVFYCTSTPCFLPGKGGIALAYLVQISADKRIEIPHIDNKDNSQILTRRQMEIVHFIAEGMSNREIAGELVISEGTVKKHVENIRDLLGVSSRIGILKKLNMI